MSCVNPNDPLFKILLKEIKNPLLAEIEFDKQQDYKPGIEELFESNPELASIGNKEQYSQYLDTIKSNVILPTDKVVFGHPTIGKSFLKKQGEDKFISLDDDYATEINNKVKEIADKYNVTTYQVKDGGTQKWNNEYNQMMQKMFNVAKQRAISENKTLFTSNTNLLRNNAESFDKVINLTDKEFERRIQERGAKYDIKRWKSQINEAISKLPANKVINTDKYLSDLFLGSKQDIEGFKEFIGKEEVVGDVDRNDELDSYITNQLFTKLGITVPNKNNETLISQADIDTFNNAVAMNGNIQPSEYYNGINDAHKWRLNQKNLYDLVDATTGDVYLKNINLSKGVQENVDVPYTPVNEEERDIMIDSINEAVNNYRLDEILAEKGYDVNDIISNLEAASNQEELNSIINKLLNKIC